MLFFGTSISRSLLNPNQLRFKGIQVQNDYTHDEPFGITLPLLFSPFSLSGTHLHFSSLVPTDDELESLPHIQMTSDAPWDPNTVQLRSPVPQIATATTTRCDESDPAYPVLSSISTSLSPMLLRARISSLATAPHRHNKSDPATLARVWKVGLDTAALTLEVTTQQAIRTALHPIT